MSKLSVVPTYYEDLKESIATILENLTIRNNDGELLTL